MVKITTGHRIQIDGGDWCSVFKTDEGRLSLTPCTLKTATELYQLASALQDVATEILKEEKQLQQEVAAAAGNE